MDTRRAVRVDRFGGPEALKIQNASGQAASGPRRGRWCASRPRGVNPVDWKFREGFFKDLPLPFIPGGDFCGTIAELGPDAAGFKAGDIVFGCAPGSVGAEAEFLAVPVKDIALKPRSLEPVEAAGVPLAGMTAWQGLFTHGHLKSGETVLILGASGAVGSIAVQLAKIVGARVIGTASGESVERLRELGCDEPVDYERLKFEDAARGMDLCLDLVGGEFQQRAFATVKRGGRIVFRRAGARRGALAPARDRGGAVSYEARRRAAARAGHEDRRGPAEGLGREGAALGARRRGRGAQPPSRGAREDRLEGLARDGAKR